MKDFHPKRSEFYYVKMMDRQAIRDNRISELFGEELKITYLGANSKKVDKIYYARFWKDKKSAEWAASQLAKRSETIFEVLVMDRDTFIKSIKDNKDKDYVYLKNIKLKAEEVDYKEKESKFLSQYKCISAYKFPDKWQKFLPCRNCGLRPLVWEFNNGRSTACGCGENEYNHFSVKAESVMSYVTRNGGSALNYKSDELLNNWNYWVKTGEHIFEAGGDRW